MRLFQHGQRRKVIKRPKPPATMFTEQPTVSCGWRWTAECASAWDHPATAASEVKPPPSRLVAIATGVFDGEEWQVRSIWSSLWPPEHWESHTDLPEIRALQGRRPEDQGAGDGDEEVSDDEEEDDEDQGFDRLKETEEEQPGFIVNMYNTLRERECEWQLGGAQAALAPSPSWPLSFFPNLHSLCSSSSSRVFWVDALWLPRPTV